MLVPRPNIREIPETMFFVGSFCLRGLSSTGFVFPGLQVCKE